MLLAPLRQEDLGRPLPDPTADNKNLRLYTDALREAAKKRGLTFADMNDFLGDGPKAPPLTDDGMHLTGAGYWRSAFALEQASGLPERTWSIEVTPRNDAKRRAKASDVGDAGSADFRPSTPHCRWPRRTADEAARPAPAPDRADRQGTRCRQVHPDHRRQAGRSRPPPTNGARA